MELSYHIEKKRQLLMIHDNIGTSNNEEEQAGAHTRALRHTALLFPSLWCLGMVLYVVLVFGQLMDGGKIQNMSGKMCPKCIGYIYPCIEHVIIHVWLPWITP